MCVKESARQVTADMILLQQKQRQPPKDKTSKG